MMTEFKKITENKKDFIDLLLLADEDEHMVDKYLTRGEMYVLYDPDPVAECVVTDEGDGVFEVKNLAVTQTVQKKGYGRRMLAFVEETYRGRAKCLIVGTGDSPLTLPFYQKCGFQISHRIKNFFTDNYDHPIVEDGVTLVDMVILKKEL